MSTTPPPDPIPSAGHLTNEQITALTTVERVGSVLSLIGCLFIIVTFWSSKAFHKPINRLVFYASFGNMLTNVGTLMAREYISNVDSPGCQLQGFIIQMFLPADALWTLAMAVNVYLTFYFKFDAAKLRHMEIWYALLCYGVPFVPALTYVFVTNAERGRIYGDATLWCWVSSRWDALRIATFYAPVWVVIIITFAIYIRAGGEIYKRRKQLHDFSSTARGDPEPLAMDDPFSVKTTEVTVVTEDSTNPRQNGISLEPMPRPRLDGDDDVPKPPQSAAYSVTISSSARDKLANVPMPASESPLHPPPTARAGGRTQKRRANYEANNAAWSYTKCALLFFTAILITWIPSSANRVYSVIHAGQTSIVLEFMSALVLPLQGFWNAVIYTVTSWKATKMFFAELFHMAAAPRSEPQAFAPDYSERRGPTFKIPGRASHKSYETESMTELANSTQRSSHEYRRI